MAEHENVYKNETEQYHALVSYEDFTNNLTQAIRKFIPPNKKILESGAGTGRITNILLPACNELACFDLSHAMLDRARHNIFYDSWEFSGMAVADHRQIPVKSGLFDWVVSGWSVCYLVSWQPEQWRREVCSALREFLRVLKPDGKVMIIETLGTGKTTPEPPPHLIEYLDYLSDIGFQRECIRTDYRFPDMETARALTQFFFGSEMLASLENAPQPLLPECTGIWTCSCEILKKTVPG